MHAGCWIQQVTTRVGAVTCWIQQSVSSKQVVGFSCLCNSEVDQLIALSSTGTLFYLYPPLCPEPSKMLQKRPETLENAGNLEKKQNSDFFENCQNAKKSDFFQARNARRLCWRGRRGAGRGRGCGLQWPWLWPRPKII